MKNPWLRIPASDYEAHMALPEVAQAQVLSNLMASALIEYTPMSLAVIGCSTGNGFEHINTARTRRVVGIDINPGYLKILETRFSDRIPRLELIHADIISISIRFRWCSLGSCSSMWMYCARCTTSSDVWLPEEFFFRFSKKRALNLHPSLPRVTKASNASHRS